ncbi:MAG: NACHT domain-containing protein, partial [Planctomycetes bacterium]|nr:NACHT domain-containing protein [Planctomycetota bacterium]
MSLLTVLLTGVGSGITKGILKLWLKDDPIAQAAGSSVVDVIKKKTGDLLAARSARRQFEQISERAAKAVLQVVEAEAAEMDPEDQMVVARAAGETVKNTEFSAELLARHNLDPADLTESFLAKPGSEGGNPGLAFSPPQRELYRRILSESAQYIVDIASQMPSFTERTFAEVLRRESLLLDKADRIFEEVRRIRAGQQSHDAAAARFETEYRRAAVRRLDQLELFGVDLSSTAKRYKLSVAYVTLLVEQAVLADEPTAACHTPDRPDDFEDDHLEADSMEAEEDESESRETVSAHQALAASRRLFVRGPAGSGKTTLLQWVAVGAASRTLEGELEPLNGWVPLFVKLREFARGELPRPEEFPALVAPTVADEMPEGWVHDRLRSGKAIVLIDGLDELAEPRRDEVRRWLEELVGSFPEARYVLTSRPYAAEEGWLSAEQFADAELQDMGGDDVEQFVAHWHAAVKGAVQRPEEKQELDGLEEHLKEVVKGNRAIRKLATSPLLCALLCALHRDRVQRLPSDRIELYRAYCDMFLRRDLERGVSLAEYHELGNRQKWVLLQDFAYWLIKNGWSDVEREQADSRFADKLAGLSKIPPGTQGSDVRRLFVERSGILRHPTAERVDFPHRTFQEFLAAGAAVGEGDLGLLVQNAHDGQWHELIILAAGLARPNEANSLIQQLLVRGDAKKARRYQLHLLAVACLETVLEPSEEVEREVRQRLAKIVPPENMTQAKALSAAGDLVVSHLAYRAGMKTNHAAAALRTLALIGSEAAHQIVESYGVDRRKSVQRTIFPTLQCAANPLEFGKRINRLVQSLDLQGTRFPDLSLLAGLTGLQSLSLVDTQVSDLSPLAG